MTSGVYVIRCTVTRRTYFGSSADIDRRFAQHRSSLRAGKHHCAELQADWKLLGEDAFDFSLHTQAPKAQAFAIEAQLIEASMGAACYNLSTGGPGRPMVADEKRLVQRSIRLKPADWQTIETLGGMQWLRAAIDAG
jgi:hypothetical protein